MLLLDEFTSAMDAISATVANGMVELAAKRGVAVLFVSHRKDGLKADREVVLV